jgi:hypothetical protein
MIIATDGPLTKVRFAELPGGGAVQRQITAGRELLDLPAAVSAEADDGGLTRLGRLLRR